MADKSEYLEKLTTDFLPAFLAFAMKNTNNLHEAEELSQETAYQCVLAIDKAGSGGILNLNAFMWGIAHNTYKRWCARKKHVPLDDSLFDTFTNVMDSYAPIETGIIQTEENKRVHLELSRLADLYRKTLVCFYYDEMPIYDTSKKLGISVEMVKFYLQKGRQKLREAYTMSSNIGEKSFNPSAFSVYKSSVDFSKVNVWEVFKRKLPCQIALICHDSEKAVSDISIETGVPAVYIEEEIGLLIDAGVMINPVRGKYRTNLFILKKNVLAQIKGQFDKLYGDYLPAVISAYEKYLPELKKLGIFKHDVMDSRYAWFFADKAADFDFSGKGLSNEDYPQILSCGSRGFIFAAEADTPLWAGGQTPTQLGECTVWARDIGILGEYRHQRQLWHGNKAKSQSLYDVYNGRVNDKDIEIYAQLIEEGYVVKRDGTLFCNVAVSTREARNLFEQINAGLTKGLLPLCKNIRENIGRIVKSTIPPQLKNYAKGYTETWIMYFSGLCFYEALYDKGFLTLPAKDDNAPVACWIHEN